MTPAVRNPLTALALAAAILAGPSAAEAALGDCIQPVSTGAAAVVTDCLVILQTAVSANNCNGQDPCVCSPKGTEPPSATDALLCLQVVTAVADPSVLNCPCDDEPLGPQCSSGEFIALGGSDVDSGWNGLGHGQSLIEGASITAGVIKRCADDNNVICTTSADCPGGGACDLTCACDDPNNAECEVFGPTHERRCLRSLDVCDTNADCQAPETCEHLFGPPLPLSAAGTPACVISYFADAITGTANADTGEGSISAFLRSVVHLGVAGTTPCPTCGARGAGAEIGDQFTCGGGSDNSGQPCTVDAVSPDFGGVSFDCPPVSGANVSGAGLAIIFKQATTGTVGVQATLPCGFPLSQAHPVAGTGTCNDDFSLCNTNADCTRCSDTFSACTDNADCSPGATCATAPDQPVACGIYCHCGFCGGTDINQPCFSNDDCDPGVECLPGTGMGGAPEPQTRHNNCANLICGEKNTEECCPGPDCINQDTPGFGPSEEVGTCTLATFVLCDSNADCAPNNGECQFEPNSCFGGLIDRTGVPDSLDDLCSPDFTTPCTTNSDCAGGECLEISEPVTVSMFCIPPTTSQAINNAAGIPGPGVITFRGRLIAARCGDGEVEADEECDDGNLVNGDGCNEDCKVE